MTQEKFWQWAVFIVMTPCTLVLAFFSALMTGAFEFIDYPQRVYKGYFDESDNSGE